MTHLQKLIRETVLRDGYIHINVGRGSPANMGTIKALRSSNFRCSHVGHQNGMQVWLIEQATL
jgi:hypothetical protein